MSEMKVRGGGAEGAIMLCFARAIASVTEVSSCTLPVLFRRASS